ncbi:MAG TPA: diguanylate cyclase [Candidatus Xenobia bacterium]|jgi:diguanylate cyclase (GGDEF)-like protein
MPLSRPGRVLVVGCHPVDRHILVQFVRFLGAWAEAVESGHEGLRLLDIQPFDLVLLDLQLPDLSGQDVLRMLKASPSLADVPVIMLSDQTDAAAAFVPAGAEDYLLKPFHPGPVCTRVRASLDRKLLRDREAQLQQELADRTLALAEVSDPLTGLPSRRAVLQSVKQLWAMHLRSRTPLACLTIGVDGFQAFTADVSDVVMRETALALQAALRTSDMVARHGVETFLALCPDTSLDAGRICAERIQESVRSCQVPGVKLTVSVGVAESRICKDEKHLLQASERALQEAHLHGAESIVIDPAALLPGAGQPASDQAPS